MRAAQFEFVAQPVKEGAPRINVEFVCVTVDGERYVVTRHSIS